jgi:hypothetical protein
MINGKYWMKSAAIVLFSGLSLSVALAQEKKEVIIREVGDAYHS